MTQTIGGLERLIHNLKKNNYTLHVLLNIHTIHLVVIIYLPGSMTPVSTIVTGLDPSNDDLMIVLCPASPQ